MAIGIEYESSEKLGGGMGKWKDFSEAHMGQTRMDGWSD